MRSRFPSGLSLEGYDNTRRHRLLQTLRRFVRTQFQNRFEEVRVALAPESRFVPDSATAADRVGEGPFERCAG